MTADRLQELLQATVSLLAMGDPDALSMRTLGNKVGIKQSVIYYYFQNKDDLLLKTFQYASKRLGESLSNLPKDIKNVSDMLLQRIEYQFDNADFMMALLKYYVSNPEQFSASKQAAVLPPELYQHIREVLEQGVKEGTFVVNDVAADSRTITHAINGFIMESYPRIPTDKERDELITKIHGFILRALS